MGDFHEAMIQQRIAVSTLVLVLISTSSFAAPVRLVVEHSSSALHPLIRQESTPTTTATVTTAVSSTTSPTSTSAAEPDLPRSIYYNNATTEPYPASQPPQTRQQITSILIQNNSLNDSIVEEIKSCLGVATGAAAETWGLWSAVQFSSNMIQAELFCNVPDEISGIQFTERLSDYINDQGGSGLTNCLSRGRVGFTGNARLGREPEDRSDLAFNSVADGKGSSAALPGIIIGIAGLLCLLGVLVISKMEMGKTYDPSEYNDIEVDPAAPPRELTEEEELAMLAQ